MADTGDTVDGSHIWDNLTPGILGTFLLCWEFFRLGFEFYLAYRQKRVYSQNLEVPKVLRGSITVETFEKARLYRTDRVRLRMFQYVYNCFLTTMYMRYGIMFILWSWSGRLLDLVGIWSSGWDREIGQTICFIAIGTMFFNLVQVPLDLFFVFEIEQSHGFNKQTLWYFIKDHLRMNSFQVLIGAVVGVFIVKIVQVGGKHFYIWLWILSWILGTVSILIYPTFIAPIFNAYKPLREGRLRNRLTRLATICDFPLKDILIIQESKRSKHPGAYFFGLWDSKKVVLYDNLLIGHPDEDVFSDDSEEESNALPQVAVEANRIYSETEIEAIVCHEIGHWKKGHILEEIILTFVNVNILFFVFAYFYENSVLYEAFEFPKNSKKPVFLGLHIVVVYILDFWNLFIESAFKCRTRYYEYEADKFAVKMNYGEDLKSSIIKMHRDNLNYPYYDKLYSAFKHQHPPQLNRLEAIDNEMMKQN